MIVRLTEREFLATPALWSSEGLIEWLREQGLDPSRPYERVEDEHALVFVQMGDATASPYIRT